MAAEGASWVASEEDRESMRSILDALQRIVTSNSRTTQHSATLRLMARALNPSATLDHGRADFVEFLSTWEGDIRLPWGEGAYAFVAGHGEARFPAWQPSLSDILPDVDAREFADVARPVLLQRIAPRPIGLFRAAAEIAIAIDRFSPGDRDMAKLTHAFDSACRRVFKDHPGIFAGLNGYYARLRSSDPELFAWVMDPGDEIDACAGPMSNMRDAGRGGDEQSSACEQLPEPRTPNGSARRRPSKRRARSRA